MSPASIESNFISESEQFCEKCKRNNSSEANIDEEESTSCQPSVSRSIRGQCRMFQRPNGGFSAGRWQMKALLARKPFSYCDHRITDPDRTVVSSRASCLWIC